MNKSENLTELAKALVEAQKEMKNATKDAVNPFFKSQYADLNSVINACRDTLNRHGIAVTQTMELQGEKTCLNTTLLHVSGQWIGSSLPLNPVKNDPQSMGSNISYARRYSLQAIVCIGAEDDDGQTATVKSHQSIPTQPSLPQQEDLRDQFDRLKEANRNDFGSNDFETFTDKYKVPFGKKYYGRTLDEMGPDNVRSYAEYLQNTSAKEGKPLGRQAGEFVEKAESYLKNHQDMRM